MWGLRRSTIARREFMEAVSCTETLPSTRRGRGRGRSRRKRTYASDDAPQHLKPEQERVSDALVTDQAEDSDDLSLQEIRRRVLARQELQDTTDGSVIGTDEGAGSRQKQGAETSDSADDNPAALPISIENAKTELECGQTSEPNFCSVCEDRQSNRMVVGCDSCRAWRHVDCVCKSTDCEPQRKQQESCKDEQKTRGAVQMDQKTCTEPKSFQLDAASAIKNIKTEDKPAAPPAEGLQKSQKRLFLAKLFKVKINETPAQQPQEQQQQEEKKERSFCSAEITDQVQASASSAPAVDCKPTTSNGEEVKSDPNLTLLSHSSPQTIPTLENVSPVSIIKKSTPGKARKTMMGSPRLELLKGALNQSTASHRKVQNRTLVEGSTVDESSMVPHSIPLQTRENIRSSLSKAFIQRLNESGDVTICENEVEKLVVNMEKEMFNMCYTTDHDYKKKCHCLILGLKNPKNMNLCHQVMNGDISIVKFIHLNQQEKTIAEETVSVPVLQMASKNESLPASEDVEKPQPKKVITATSPESRMSHIQHKHTQKKNPNPVVISTMLRNTTSQHQSHLFDLNCRICTVGHLHTYEDPEPMKPKMDKPNTPTEEKESFTNTSVVEKSDEVESPASPKADNCETQRPSADLSPVLIPSIPVLSVSRRDPRTAQFRLSRQSSHAPELAPTPTQDSPPVTSVMKPTVETNLVPTPPFPLLPMVPKSILMKPSSPVSRLDAAMDTAKSLTESNKGTKVFLKKQDILWKGFLNMPTVTKFVTKGYLISGSPNVLRADLPDTIQIGGRILPQTVWEYVDLVKMSEAKELSLIRFHPSSEEEEVAYVSLFSYFNSRRRFGVVSNVSKHIKDLYLIPLCAKQSIPAVLLPIEGPGLEENHPNLLIGLAVCQKQKHLETLPVNSKTCDLNVEQTPNPSSVKTLHADVVHKACDADIELSANGSKAIPPSGTANYLTTSDPLQSILATLFGKKKQHSEIPHGEVSITSEPFLHSQQTIKKEGILVSEDDRPYDPEEYDPAVTLVPLSKPSATDNDDDRPYDPEEEYNAFKKCDPVGEIVSEESLCNHHEARIDEAYDPEDETMFNEMQSYITSSATPQKSPVCEMDNISMATLSEQQKILEDLNRQIEEHKRQLEEQTESLRIQTEAIGVSMAHFSVSDALMSPPPQFGRDEEGHVDETSPIQNEHTQTSRKLFQDQITYKPKTCETEDVNSQNLSENESKNNMTLNKLNETVSSKDMVNTDEVKPQKESLDTKCSYKKERNGRSRTSAHLSTRSREHRSYHQDRPSSRTSHAARNSKDVSDKDHRRWHSATKHRESGYRERKRSESTHRHHSNSASPSRYSKRRRVSTSRSSQIDIDQSRKTNQQGTEICTKKSTNQMHSEDKSGQNGATANDHNKLLPEIEVDSSSVDHKTHESNSGLLHGLQRSSDHIQHTKYEFNKPEQHFQSNQIQRSEQRKLLSPKMPHPPKDFPLRRQRGRKQRIKRFSTTSYSSQEDNDQSEMLSQKGPGPSTELRPSTPQPCTYRALPKRFSDPDFTRCQRLDLTPSQQPHIQQVHSSWSRQNYLENDMDKLHPGDHPQCKGLSPSITQRMNSKQSSSQMHAKRTNSLHGAKYKTRWSPLEVPVQSQEAISGQLLGPERDPLRESQTLEEFCPPRNLHHQSFENWKPTLSPPRMSQQRGFSSDRNCNFESTRPYPNLSLTFPSADFVINDRSTTSSQSRGPVTENHFDERCTDYRIQGGFQRQGHILNSPLEAMQGEPRCLEDISEPGGHEQSRFKACGARSGAYFTTGHESRQPSQQFLGQRETSDLHDQERHLPQFSHRYYDNCEQHDEANSSSYHVVTQLQYRNPNPRQLQNHFHPPKEETQMCSFRRPLLPTPAGGPIRQNVTHNSSNLSASAIRHSRAGNNVSNSEFIWEEEQTPNWEGGRAEHRFSSLCTSRLGKKW